MGQSGGHLHGRGDLFGVPLRFPQRVEKLVLVDSHGLGGEVPGGLATYALARLPLLNRAVWAGLRRSRRMAQPSV